MVFERLEKKLLVPTTFGLALTLSSNCLADGFGSQVDGVLSSECTLGMDEFQCSYYDGKRDERALNYFKHFIALNAMKYSLEETGYLPAIKRGVKILDEFRTVHTSFGSVYYLGDGVEIADFMGVKDSYFEIDLKFGGDFKIDGFNLQYSIRF